MKGDRKEVSLKDDETRIEPGLQSYGIVSDMNETSVERTVCNINDSPVVSKQARKANSSLIWAQKRIQDRQRKCEAREVCFRELMESKPI